MGNSLVAAIGNLRIEERKPAISLDNEHCATYEGCIKDALLKLGDEHVDMVALEEKIQSNYSFRK
jgi:hypothetical protein